MQCRESTSSTDYKIFPLEYLTKPIAAVGEFKNEPETNWSVTILLVDKSRYICYVGRYLDGDEDDVIAISVGF